MAGVASGDSTSAIAETILGMNRFAAGVPADDATCNAIIEMLKSRNDALFSDRKSPFEFASLQSWVKPEDRLRGDGGDVPLEVSERHFVQINYSPGSDDDSGEVCAVFRTKRQWREGTVDCGN